MRFLFLLLLCPVLAFGQAFSFQDLPFLSQGGGTDWERRVIANGGAQPSANTVLAMETLRLGCIAAGLTNKIHSLCVFVPDSVIAATTPLFKHFGSDPWTNNGGLFVSGDLTVNGLKGDLTKSLDTGVAPVAIASANDPPRGLTVIVTEAQTNRATPTIGCVNPAGTVGMFLEVSSNGRSGFCPATVNAAFLISTNDFARVGYVSANLTTNVTTNITLYVASPLESHKIITNRQPAITVWTTAADEGTISCFALKQDGTNTQYVASRLSLAMITKGFTQAEDAAFWNLALACRQQIGGGTGDPIHDYNTKVVAAGGAAISTTTSNALRTLYSGFDTDATLYSLSVVNAMVPDNLVATRTPFIWQAGSMIWTNFNFGTTNLSVVGLQGNGTDKYLGTGIVPSTANRISDVSGGISGIISDNPGTASAVILGGNPATANVLCDIFVASGATRTRLWRNDLVNQNFLRADVPSTTWAGYISGNRTAADAIAIYIASSTNTHQIVTNATGTQTGTAAANTTSLITFARNGNGTPADFGNHTVSFVAFHGGLTQTQSSNVYNRASAFRAAVSGGNP